MVLKQGESMIGLTTKRKNLLVLDTWAQPSRVMLSKRRGKPTYLLNKNLQIRLCHQQLGYVSNAKVIEAFKLTDGIDIMIEEGQQI